MSAESVLRGEYNETVKRLDEKIEDLSGDVKELKGQVADNAKAQEASNAKTQADMQALTQTINRWGGAFAVILFIMGATVSILVAVCAGLILGIFR